MSSPWHSQGSHCATGRRTQQQPPCKPKHIYNFCWKFTQADENPCVLNFTSTYIHMHPRVYMSGYWLRQVFMASEIHFEKVWNYISVVKEYPHLPYC